MILSSVQDSQYFHPFPLNLIINDVFSVRHPTDRFILMLWNERKTLRIGRQKHAVRQQLVHKGYGSRRIELRNVITDALEVVFRIIGDDNDHARRSFRIA